MAPGMYVIFFLAFLSRVDNVSSARGLKAFLLARRMARGRMTLTDDLRLPGLQVYQRPLHLQEETTLLRDELSSI